MVYCVSLRCLTLFGILWSCSSDVACLLLFALRCGLLDLVAVCLVGCFVL